MDNGIDYGIGHKGRDVGYSANLFYFPGKGVTHIFFVNYGTDGDSRLRQTFYDFIDELVKISLK
jgi:D-alanyl-D-alanine carboxypeptidase